VSSATNQFSPPRLAKGQNFCYNGERPLDETRGTRPHNTIKQVLWVLILPKSALAADNPHSHFFLPQ